MQTPITGDTFAFSTFHFHLKEHSVDCAKKKNGDENKNTEYCRLRSESVLGKLKIKVSRGGFIYLCGFWGSVYLK